MIEPKYLIVIPAAGSSTNFAAKGYRGPKALIKIRFNNELQTMIEHVAQHDDDCIVICKRIDFNIFKRALPHFFVRPIESTEGQAHTVYQGIWDMTAGVMAGREYLIVNWDVAFEDGLFDRFVEACRKNNAEVGAVVFKSTEARYDYVDAAPFFTRAVRKEPSFSDYALTGAFYFKSRVSFSMAYKNNPRPPLYISQMFGRIVGVHFAYEIEREQFHDWSTPEDLENDSGVTLIAAENQIVGRTK